MNTNAAQLTRHLVTDETVTLFSKMGDELCFRVRIWRGLDATSLVLVSPTADAEGFIGVSPDRLTVRMANYVLATMLGHPCHLMLYFEENIRPGEPGTALEQVHFEYFGQAHRLKMFKPIRRPTEWDRLEYILQSPVEHDHAT